MSQYYAKMKIVKIRRESPKVRTLELDKPVAAKPGQFVMLWIPGLNEKPICVANAKPSWLSVAKVGPFSSAVHQLREGDAVSVRGPYGKGFTIPKKGQDVVLVGGGYGVAALHFLALEAKKAGAKVRMVIGARNKEEIIFEKMFEAAGVEVIIATDDGTAGLKCRAHEALEKALAKRPADRVYACGPEKMMEAVARLCAAGKIPCELSLERYMGCGLGICGKCDCGGMLVCRDGPVFPAEKALSLDGFGKFHRDTTGKKIPW